MIQIGQVYRDNDSRVAGRTLRVVAVNEHEKTATLEVLTNADDVQKLLDDDQPGTRYYRPQDRRGKTTRVSLDRLGTDTQRGFTLLPEQPEISGPTG